MSIHILVNYDRNIHGNKECLDLDRIKKTKAVLLITYDKNKNETNIIILVINILFIFR